MNELKTKIRELHSKLVEEYEPTIQHFNIGDEAWVVCANEPTKVIITDIDDFSEKGTKPGGYIYYWYEFKNISKIRKYYEHAKFYLWYYGLSHFGINQFKVYYKLGPGHSELCGKDSVLFKTRIQAILDDEFQKIYDSLDTISLIET